MWAEQEVTTTQYRDNPPFGPDPGDVPIGSFHYSRRPLGTRNGMILDSSPATAFEILRREPNGGLLQLLDYPVLPRERWRDKESELYQFIDELPTGTSSEYVARGIVGGAPTTTSPISNSAFYGEPTIGTITLQFPTDTTVVWDPVPNAAFYICQVFQFRASTPQERILASAPIPVYVGQSVDIFVGISTQPNTVGRNHPFNGDVLTARDYPPNEVLFRVAALDAEGNLIAACAGDEAFVQSETYFERYPSGAATLPRPRGFASNRLDRP
jgi:hypothetical protein